MGTRIGRDKLLVIRTTHPHALFSPPARMASVAGPAPTVSAAQSTPA